jgi:hypothetical protein
MAPAAYIWDQAQTDQRLIAAQNTLAYYENQLGSLDRYLASSRTWPITAARRASRRRRCTPAEGGDGENRRLASESQEGQRCPVQDLDGQQTL